MSNLVDKAFAHEPVMQVDIKGLPLHSRGKVRDTYDLGDKLLVITTDRISAFDHVLPNGIPGKGKILNQLTAFWFNCLSAKLTDLKHHMITTDFWRYVGAYGDESLKTQLAGRTMVVRKLKILPIEIVWRKYIAGSLWKEYQQAKNVGSGATVRIRDFELPSDLLESSRLPQKILTPATKAQEGHDLNICFDEMVQIVDTWAIANGLFYERPFFEILRELSSKIYSNAFAAAWEKGIIIADTKFEFGIDEAGSLVLADEVLTPDSSRFWSRDQYKEGNPQESFDKQYVRDFLETRKWDKKSPPPKLPYAIIQNTTKKYIEAFQKLVGKDPIL